MSGYHLRQSATQIDSLEPRWYKCLCSDVLLKRLYGEPWWCKRSWISKRNKLIFYAVEQYSTTKLIIRFQLEIQTHKLRLEFKI